MLIKKSLKFLLKIIIGIIKFPFKMAISVYYINIGKVDEAEDILSE